MRGNQPHFQPPPDLVAIGDAIDDAIDDPNTDDAIADPNTDGEPGSADR
jgi:hypothetical protein